MDFLQSLKDSLQENKYSNSFCIDNQFYTYQDLNNAIEQIAALLKKNAHLINSGRVAIICTNHLNTYAGLLACWFCGYAYVPLGLHNPPERNVAILSDADIAVILSTKQLDKDAYTGFTIIDTVNDCKQSEAGENETLSNFHRQDLAYILFTSGSTGKPKGVPITLTNLEAFIKAFKNSPIKFNAADKCLQMYELTFDMSVSSYLPALIAGACVYTVADSGIKYLNVLKTIKEYELTILQIVPSVIRLGSSLLSRLNFPHVHTCLVSGEATTNDLLQKIEQLMPNAAIYNYYGPTEATIYCSCYPCPREHPKLYNGMIAIGKPFTGITFEIINPDSLLPLDPFEKGELLISGEQVTNGYLNNTEKNKEAFILTKDRAGNQRVFYRSGDMCYLDNDSDVYYCGRYDNQVKIQGFRVELNEIEFVIRDNFRINNVVYTIQNNQQLTELVLVLESPEDAVITQQVLEYLKTKLPVYMIPGQVHTLTEFPVNTSGKTDRKKIKDLFGATV